MAAAWKANTQVGQSYEGRCARFVRLCHLSRRGLTRKSRISNRYVIRNDGCSVERLLSLCNGDNWRHALNGSKSAGADCKYPSG